MSKKNKPGTAFVLFLVFGIALMVIAMVVLKAGSTMIEIVHDRLRWVQQMRATQALVYYGIAYCKQMKNDSKPFSLVLDSWSLADRNFQGKVQGELLTNGYAVTGILLQEGEEQSIMQAIIEQKNNHWNVISWQEGKKMC